MKAIIFSLWMVFVALSIPFVLLGFLLYAAKIVIEEIFMEESWPD